MIGVRAATAQPAGCSDSTSVEGSRRSLPSSWRWPLGERPTRSEWRSGWFGWCVACFQNQKSAHDRHATWAEAPFFEGEDPAQVRRRRTTWTLSDARGRVAGLTPAG
jgi:hypothetical protein